MKNIDIIQDSIDLIEDSLKTALTAAKLTQIAGYSLFHYTKCFKAL